jgi:vacuolar-type H+-ATPase subunit I/STV1
MKTIKVKIVVPDDGADNVSDALCDFLFFALEDVRVLGPKTRKSSKKEKRKYRKSYPDEEA